MLVTVAGLLVGAYAFVSHGGSFGSLGSFGGAPSPGPSSSAGARAAGSAAAELEPLTFDRNPFEEE